MNPLGGKTMSLNYLSEKEAKISRTITNKLSELPEEVKTYIQKKDLSNTSQNRLLAITKKLDLFYSQIAQDLNKSKKDITAKDIDTHGKSAARNYLKETSQKETASRINYTYEYFNWLKEEGLIKEAPIQQPHKVNPKKKKRISSPDEVHLTQDDKDGNMTNTIDGKYSIIKKYIAAPKEYCYIIRDNKTQELFKDQKGNDLEIKQFMEARAFVKDLYKNKRNTK